MWSISASGHKDNVLNKIQNATPPVGTVDEVRAFRAAQEECRKQVEALDGDGDVTVLASGSGEDVSITVGKVPPPEEPEPPKREVKAKVKAKAPAPPMDPDPFKGDK